MGTEGKGSEADVGGVTDSRFEVVANQEIAADERGRLLMVGWS